MPGSPTGRFYCGKDLEDSELHALGSGIAAVYTHRRPDSHAINEDCCAIIPYDGRSGLLVVADCAGGLPRGECASEIIVSALRHGVRKEALVGSELRGAVLDALEDANLKIADLGVGAGTTVAIAEITGNHLRTYHVGDSQIMLVGQKGKIKRTTKAHSPVGYAIEAGLLDPSQARSHKERHLVSNLVGMNAMSVELGCVIELSPQDTLVIASDGLFDNLHEEEIVAFCRMGQLLTMAQAMAADCRQRMQSTGPLAKPDDLSFIAYRRRAGPQATW